MKTVGVLALQGAVSEHLSMLAALGVTGVAVKYQQDLDGLDGLIIPGGESTAISRLIQENDLYEALQNFAQSHPVLGTCAGLILCGNRIINDDGKVKPLNLMDMCVERNGFGRQIDSFEVELDVKGIGKNIPAVFIRAPYIASVGDDVEVLAYVDDKIVMAKQGKTLVMAFHPELTDDTRIFEFFINQA